MAAFASLNPTIFVDPASSRYECVVCKKVPYIGAKSCRTVQPLTKHVMCSTCVPASGGCPSKEIKDPDCDICPKDSNGDAICSGHCSSNSHEFDDANDHIKKILKLKVKCENKNCGWEGSLEDYTKRHFDGCISALSAVGSGDDEGEDQQNKITGGKRSAPSTGDGVGRAHSKRNKTGDVIPQPTPISTLSSASYSRGGVIRGGKLLSTSSSNGGVSNPPINDEDDDEDDDDEDEDNEDNKGRKKASTGLPFVSSIDFLIEIEKSNIEDNPAGVVSKPFTIGGSTFRIHISKESSKECEIYFCNLYYVSGPKTIALTARFSIKSDWSKTDWNSGAVTMRLQREEAIKLKFCTKKTLHDYLIRRQVVNEPMGKTSTKKGAKNRSKLTSEFTEALILTTSVDVYSLPKKMIGSL